MTQGFRGRPLFKEDSSGVHSSKYQNMKRTIIAIFKEKL